MVIIYVTKLPSNCSTSVRGWPPLALPLSFPFISGITRLGVNLVSEASLVAMALSLCYTVWFQITHVGFYNELGVLGLKSHACLDL